jgi:hypothetical protein
MQTYEGQRDRRKLLCTLVSPENIQLSLFLHNLRWSPIVSACRHTLIPSPLVYGIILNIEKVGSLIQPALSCFEQQALIIMTVQPRSRYCNLPWEGTRTYEREREKTGGGRRGTDGKEDMHVNCVYFCECASPGNSVRLPASVSGCTLARSLSVHTNRKAHTQ